MATGDEINAGKNANVAKDGGIAIQNIYGAANIQARNPDGIYQLGRQVGEVIAARVDLTSHVVVFGELRGGENINTGAEFEYRDYVLLLDRIDGRGIDSINNGQRSVRYEDAVCRIVRGI